MTYYCRDCLHRDLCKEIRDFQITDHTMACDFFTKMKIAKYTLPEDAEAALTLAEKATHLSRKDTVYFSVIFGCKVLMEACIKLENEIVYGGSVMEPKDIIKYEQEQK